MVDYTGKGDPYKYWTNTGRHFGFPECCIRAFLEEDLPATTPYDGTGFRCCRQCLYTPYEEMIEAINSRRKHPTPFPNDAGFLEKYQEGMYEQ